MESRYAYMVYTTDFDTTEQNYKGELIEFNRPAYKGQIDLVGTHTYELISRDFPDRIKGGIIQEDNLLNVIRQLFEGIEKDYNSLADKDDYLRMRFNEFKNVLDYVVMRANTRKKFKDMPRTAKVMGIDMDISRDVNDLANKFFNLQYEIRGEQIRNKNAANTVGASENSATAKRM